MISFKTYGKWQEFANALDKVEFQKRLKESINKANTLNARVVQKEVRRSIRAKDFVRNAPLTEAIKHSSTPLIDHGDLLKAITTKQISWNADFVGVLYTNDNVNIAEVLHEGATIPVTDKMRALFWVLWQASIGELDPATLTGRAADLWARKPGDWRPLKDSTAAIIIPPRPFMKQAFENTEVKAKIVANWEQAVDQALKAPP